MGNPSYWLDTAGPSSFPTAAGEITADVAIIGGGITGITAAMLLSEAGKSVVVLEALRVGEGTTGFSTGNLYATVDEQLVALRDKWDQKTVNAVVRSRVAAMKQIEETISARGIDCGFARRPHYIYPTNAKLAEQMQRELETARDAGLDASVVQEVPLPFPVDKALKLEGQAQFHPLAYVRGLARAIASDTCRIFENSGATEIDGGESRISTAGATIRAAQIIIATHTPKGFDLVQTELGPYREYGIAARLTEDAYPEGIFWSMEEPGHSIRSYNADGTKHLIVIGEKHKTGQPEPGVDYFARVEEFARSHFSIASFTHRWSAQHYRPADGLPYIGHSAGADDIHLATGFSTNGLVYGPLAAMILSDAILGRDNPWSDLYKATRFTPAKSAGEFLKENLDTAREMVADRLSRADVEALADVGPGQGKIAELGSHKLAVYRSDSGAVEVLSPVCPHLGCIVHWNGLERTWDCPCHGSRFAPDGGVLEGPAIKGLERKHVADDAALTTNGPGPS